MSRRKSYHRKACYYRKGIVIVVVIATVPFTLNHKKVILVTRWKNNSADYEHTELIVIKKETSLFFYSLLSLS